MRGSVHPGQLIELEREASRSVASSLKRYVYPIIGKLTIPHKSETTAAYQRGQKLEKRRALMKGWAAFLTGTKVVSLDDRRVG